VFRDDISTLATQIREGYAEDESSCALSPHLTSRTEIIPGRLSIPIANGRILDVRRGEKLRPFYSS